MIMIICAMKAEAKPFLDALVGAQPVKIAGAKAYRGTLEGKEVLLVRSGVGIKKAFAVTVALLSQFDITQVIMGGSAGAMDKRLKLGDTVVASEQLYHSPVDGLVAVDGAIDYESGFPADPGMFALAQQVVDSDPPSQAVYFGRIVSGKDFVSEKDRPRVTDTFQPLCADMESAAVAHACQLKGIPFIAVRGISDNEEKSGLFVFFKNLALAAESSYSVARRLVKAMQGAG